MKKTTIADACTSARTKDEQGTEAENMYVSPTGAKPNVSSRFTCDHCEENWEIGFRCPKCSDKLVTVERYRPNLHWSGYQAEDEYEYGEEDEYTGDVCKNCCNCQFNGC